MKSIKVQLRNMKYTYILTYFPPTLPISVNVSSTLLDAQNLNYHGSFILPPIYEHSANLISTLKIYLV